MNDRRNPKLEDDKYDDQDFFDEGERAGIKISDEEKRAAFGGEKKIRNPILAFIVLFVTLFVMSSAIEELMYFFSPSEPVELGNVSQEVALGKDFETNRYVSVAGIPDPRRASSKDGSEKTEFFLLLGSWIFVQRTVAIEEDTSEDYGEYIGRGRLVRLDETGKYKNLFVFLKDRLRLDMPEGKTYLLIQDMTPQSLWYLLLIYAMLLIIFAINAYNIYVFFKRRFNSKR